MARDKGSQPGNLVVMPRPVKKVQEKDIVRFQGRVRLQLAAPETVARALFALELAEEAVP